jgi:hypothetical protein
MRELEIVSRVVHEAMRAYNYGIHIGQPERWLPPWGDAPEWMKQSTRDAVELHMANPDLTPEGSHEVWMQARKEAGWVHGVRKNDRLLTHPCMVPWEELPPEEQAKDLLFKRIVQAMVEVA